MHLIAEPHIYIAEIACGATGMLCRLVGRLQGAVVHGLPTTTFPISEVHQAFQLLKSGGNVGKVVLSSPHTSLVPVDLRLETDPLMEGQCTARSQSTALRSAVDVHIILGLAKDIAGRSVNADEPLMEAGVDSLGAVELRNQLGDAADDQSLPSTVVFDHPTARRLAELLSISEVPAVAAVPQRQAVHSGSLLVVMDGLSALLPTGVTGGGSAWHISACAFDAVGNVPPSRWSSAEPVAGTHGATHHGGFAHGVDQVDNSRFGVSPAEAAAMDPQQRLLLERGYEALHIARLDRASLGGSLTGIFVGMAAVEWVQMLASSPGGGSVYAATGSSHSITSGRLAYVLDLHGACASYDSACSAALVASIAALRALQGNECTRGLAAGVNLMLTPAWGSIFATAGMTSPLGRSHTFDARADGYARAEACAAVSLAPLTGADTEGGALSAGVYGCAVRSDGRSASITAPNGQAQQNMLRSALFDAAVSAEHLATLEAHGTGTALGDPIEAGALEGAVLIGRPVSCTPLSVCGVKANIGHAEPAAGLTGLVRLVVGLVWGGTPPNAQLHALNPHIRGMMRRGSSMMPTQLAFVALQATGGVSSFGYSGTIAHAALRSRSEKVILSPPCTGGTRTGHTLFYHRRFFPWRQSLPSTTVTKRTGTYSICWPRLLSAAMTEAGPCLLLVCSPSAVDGVSSSTSPSLVSPPWQAVAIFLCEHDWLAPFVVSADLVLALAQHLGSLVYSRLVVFTYGPPSTAPGSAWGIARVARLELPSLDVQSAAVTRDASGVALLALTGHTTEPEVAWCACARHVARLRDRTTTAPKRSRPSIRSLTLLSYLLRQLLTYLVT